MKKVLAWGIPAVILLALVGWRFSTRASSGNQGSGGSGQQKGGASGGGGSGRGAPSVEVAIAQGRAITQTLQSVGTVQSPFKVEISPKAAGRIATLTVREGDSVTAGQVLFVLDTGDLKAAELQQEANVADARSKLAQAKMTQGSTNVGITSQIQQQQAGLGSAQANYSQVQQNYGAQVSAALAQVSAASSAVANARAALDKENATLADTQTKYDRTYSLYKQGFIAAQDVDDARTALNVQQGSVRVAESQVAAAQSQLQTQQQNLSIVKRKGISDIAASKAVVAQAQATVRVAQANRAQTPAYQENLDALSAQVGVAVAQLKQAQSHLADTTVKSPISGTVTARKADPGALASPGSPVLEVQYMDWLYVTTSIPVDFSSQIRPGLVANLTLDGLPGQTFSGPISNINPAADPQSRQFDVLIRLDNKGHQIRPGMYAKVNIVTGNKNAQVTVPREAITTAPDGSNTVTVVDADGVAHVRAVKLGISDDKGSEVLDGVQPGDQVVILTFNPLKDGQQVSVAKPGGQEDGGRQGGSPAGGGKPGRGGRRRQQP